jgi:nicotinamidase-related amidase
MVLQRHFVHYCEQLEKAGKYQLLIWPYHTMLGSVGHALVPAIAEICHLHDIARGSQTQHEIKGGNPLTENYSPFCPEVLTTPDGKGGMMPIAQRNATILDLLLNHDVVFFAGQAKSHCYAWAVDDLLVQIQQKDPSLVNRVHLLEDCTSPVVIPNIIDFTDQANEAFDRFRDAGMHVVQSTQPVHEYLSIG